MTADRRPSAQQELFLALVGCALCHAALMALAVCCAGIFLHRTARYAFCSALALLSRLAATRAARRVAADVGPRFGAARPGPPRATPPASMSAGAAALRVAALTGCGLLAAWALLHPVAACVLASPFLLLLAGALCDPHAAGAVADTLASPFRRPLPPLPPRTAGVCIEPYFPWAVPVRVPAGIAGDELVTI